VVASCDLPGLSPPVRLPDGHQPVDGGIVDGVPAGAALEAAGPADVVLVLDCGLAPVTGRVDVCAATVDVLTGQACGVPVQPGVAPYPAPVDQARGALDTVLRAFTVARDVANPAAVRRALDDPRVHVLPHVADAWAAGGHTTSQHVDRRGRDGAMAGLAGWIRSSTQSRVTPTPFGPLKQVRRPQWSDFSRCATSCDCRTIIQRQTSQDMTKYRCGASG
jgi:predicted acylesterase/phospholipase RssA